ncbi:aminoglycoside phosphotransferase [Microbacterium candidum]|uniref:Aminoglycoside phosphotransferase n=1 Tax=Microbacterium candidum TaxID=3041922 RepID=A0ABT7N2G5_9MICO|nr:aminoglycoside phosphotransferase [Microbacterium sp. ASV49]MDL9980889.1 aminoglycoside phosphotransferase [Microbacterium sp. ASV49]
MARSPLTLAASVTSALPRVGVVSVGSLTDGGTGRYDSAVAELDDGRRVVVRASTDEAASAALTAQARALRALTPGVRALLPFAAPELLGEADLDSGRAVVLDFIPGYHVDAGHVPAGPGVATILGAAIAAVHALPTTVVRSEGLTMQTPEQSRDAVARVVDRTEHTHRAPAALIARWRAVLAAANLWRFEASVVLGGVESVDFLFADGPHGPAISGLLEWSGLAVGDPALDLRWTSSAPDAASDVFEAYAAALHRAPDAGLRARARLYAELEFAKWLLHGVDDGDEEIVADAEGLLASLADGVSGDALTGDADLDVDHALALLDRVAAAAPAAVDTSMQTDAFDADVLAEYLDTDDLTATRGAAAVPSPDTQPLDAAELAELRRIPPRSADASALEEAIARNTGGIDLEIDENATAPIALDRPSVPASSVSAYAETDVHDPVADQADAERASRAALHRWASSDSE